MKSLFVVCGIITYNNKILILKKADDDYNYPGKWSFVGGFVKEFEPGELTIIREIKEETGLDASILKTGQVVIGKDPEKGIQWITLPFLCKVNSDKVNLDHENTEFAWIAQNELEHYPFVPGIKEALTGIGFL